MDHQDYVLAGNGIIEEAVARFQAEATQEKLFKVLDALRYRMHNDGQFLIPLLDGSDIDPAEPRTVTLGDGSTWLPAFTSPQEGEKGEGSRTEPRYIDALLQGCMERDGLSGLILNPWSQPFLIPSELIAMIADAEGWIVR